MKIKKVVSGVFVIALLGLLLPACGGKTELNSIFITPTSSSIPVGAAQQYSATGNYSDGGTKDLTTQIVWASSNPGVATIDAAGYATAVAPGSTAISAIQGGIAAATVTLIVNSATLTAISVTPPSPTVILGATQQFAANGSYSDGTSFNITRQVTWRTSNTGAATVSSSGLATAVSAGTAVISATYGSVLGSTVLTVSSTPLTAISVVPALNPGGTTTLPVRIQERFKASGNSGSDITSQVTWRSSSTSVLIIDSTGLATALAPGTATITAVSGTITGSFTVTVTSATLNSISVVADPPPTVAITAGATQSFKATGTFNDGTSYNVTAQAVWSSSDTTIAIVNSSTGVATAKAVGTANIIAVLTDFPGITGSAPFTVQ